MELKGFQMKQNGTNMYVGVMSVGDILQIAQVDVYRREGDEEFGYQRTPERGRARKFARYLRGIRPMVPNSILLSLRQEAVASPGSDGSVTLTLPDDQPLWIVDGQHRIEGFRIAIEEDGDERLREYPVPVVIVAGLQLEEEAYQFQIINETMKKVRTDLARRILAKRAASGRAQRREIRNLQREWEATAVEVIDKLNTDPQSPWRGRIQGPNERKQPSHTIREVSFSTSLKPILNERPYRAWQGGKIAQWLMAYWGAWQELVPDAFANPQDYVLLKTPGVFSVNELAAYVFEVCRLGAITQPSKEDFEHILRDLGEYAGENFWRRDNIDGAAMAGGMKAFGALADTFTEELKDAGHTIE